MKHFLIILFAAIFASSLIYSQSNFDYKSDSLFVVWGKSNYSGENDCRAQVTINSDGKNIHISVNVSDNVLVFNEDPIHSDHVELWFSLPDILGEYVWHETLESNKFIISESALYLINNQPDLKKFESFLKDPLINANNAFIDSFYYSQMDDSLGEDYDWLKESIVSYLPDPELSKLQVSNFPFGVVHFGLFPESDSAIQYDRELYLPLEKFADIKLDTLSSYIQLSSQVHEQGYSLDIVLRADAIGFIPNYGISELKFLVDVVDVDTGKRQETLLSTSNNRAWGEPDTFNQLNLSKRVNVNIFGNIKSLDAAESYNASFDKVTGHMSKYFVKTLDGWTPVDIKRVQFYQYNQPEEYTMESISKIQVKQGVFKYRQESLKNNLLEYFEFSDGKYVLLNKELLLKENNIIKPILLPNGKLSLLCSEYEIHGRYTRQITSSLYLVNETSKQPIAHYLEDSPPSVLINYLNIYIEEEWDYNRLDNYKYSTPDIPWINIIDYHENDQNLKLNFSDSLQYIISWDEEGKLIK